MKKSNDYTMADAHAWMVEERNRLYCKAMKHQCDKCYLHMKRNCLIIDQKHAVKETDEALHRVGF